MRGRDDRPVWRRVLVWLFGDTVRPPAADRRPGRSLHDLVWADVAARLIERQTAEELVAARVLELADPDLLYLISWVDVGDGSARGLASWLPEDHPARAAGPSRRILPATSPGWGVCKG